MTLLVRTLDLAVVFLDTLNHAHSVVNFTMKVEEDGILSFLGVQLLNRAPCVETKVYVKMTNTGLLLRHQPCGQLLQAWLARHHA